MSKNNDKTPKRKEMLSQSRKARNSENPNEFYDKKPAWRISKMVLDDVYGWEILNAQKLIDIKDKLSSFESRKWSEILAKGEGSHLVKVDKLSKKAKDCLEKMRLDDVEQLLSLRLSGKERVWGILAEGIVNLLWWDPEHQVCPSLKKHT